MQGVSCKSPNEPPDRSGIDLITHNHPRRQRMLSHRIVMDGLGHHGVDDLVLHIRGFFWGRAGIGCQLAIVRT